MKLLIYRVEVCIGGKWKLDSETTSLFDAKITKKRLLAECGRELRVRIVRITIMHHVKVIA